MLPLFLRFCIIFGSFSILKWCEFDCITFVYCIVIRRAFNFDRNFFFAHQLNSNNDLLLILMGIEIR